MKIDFKEIITKYLEGFLDFLPTILLRGIVVIILLLFWSKLIDGVLNAYHKILRKKKIEPLLESFTSSIIKTILYVILFFIIVGVAGVKATSLVTVLGTAGIAVGLALQGSLANLAGGVLILFFKPFSKGDYIITNGLEGTVEKIQILYSILYTIDNKVIIVPNGQLANNSIVNVTKNPERRLDLVFSVAYNTSIEKVKEILNKIANEHPNVLKDKPINIRLGTQNTSSLDFIFRVWVKTEKYWDSNFDFIELVKKEFDLNNIEIPYQKIDIYHKN
ncbi:mechanosensitive ion channel family protein [Fusobacterium mortiferum]|uniref:mechanosensitive ion channel family protein n=1 Tax=Fusobacterium mortiferum TaxID=850 RepID=UPI003F8DD70C